MTKGFAYYCYFRESLNTVNEKYTLTATTAAQFSDVSTDDWFYQNVMDAVAAGIVSGRGDGTFGPNDRITRRDFAIMVSKLLLDGEDAPEATTTPFSDVAANDYGLKAIATAPRTASSPASTASSVPATTSPARRLLP